MSCRYTTETVSIMMFMDFPIHLFCKCPIAVEAFAIFKEMEG